MSAYLEQQSDSPEAHTCNLWHSRELAPAVLTLGARVHMRAQASRSQKRSVSFALTLRPLPQPQQRSRVKSQPVSVLATCLGSPCLCGGFSK